MRQEILRELQVARRAHRPVALATDLDSGEQWLFGPSDPLPGELDRELADELREVFRSDRARRVELGERTIFLNVFNPPLRMILVGAVHIAQPLAAMAAATGFQVIVVDPRTAFAAPERFPDLEIRTDWPDQALATLVPDARTAVVTLTHDPKLDDPAPRPGAPQRRLLHRFPRQPQDAWQAGREAPGRGLLGGGDCADPRASGSGHRCAFARGDCPLDPRADHRRASDPGVVRFGDIPVPMRPVIA